MNSLNLPNFQTPQITNHLLDFRTEIIRRASIAFMFVVGTAVWLVMSLNPFPAWAFLILLVVFIVAWVVYRRSQDHPTFARMMLFGGTMAGLLGIMLVESDPWVPFITLPLIFLSSVLFDHGELISGGCALLVSALLVWLGWRDYPLLAYAAGLVLTVSISWVVIFMVNTTLGWYGSMLDQSNALLKQTREDRGELSRVLKNLKLANDLQRRTELELIDARRSAEEARIMKEKFAAKVSHELRTPLALIAGFSEVMYSSPEVYGEVTWTPTMRRDIVQIYHNASHLLEMVDDILNLSRAEMAGFAISLEQVNINDLLEETADIAYDLFHNPAVRFWTDIPPGLPSIKADRTRIRQVVLNLINNARRFTEKGEVCLVARLVEQEVVISVRDTGPGIPQEKLDMIFQEFYQVDERLLRNKGGTGLGLAICKNFVETHGGRIWAESELGAGSTFIFTLPVSGVFLADDLPIDRQALAANPMRVLVIGADDHVLAMLRSVVTGYDFLRVEDRSLLRQAVALYHPKAVLLNSIPGEMAEDQEMDRDVAVPAVPLFTCTLPSTRWLVKKLGIRACLSKPVTSQMLARELAGLHGLRKVLVVDDDPDFIQLVQRIFQALDAELDIRVATDGPAGISIASAEHPRPDFVRPDDAGYGWLCGDRNFESQPTSGRYPGYPPHGNAYPRAAGVFPVDQADHRAVRGDANPGNAQPDKSQPGCDRDALRRNDRRGDPRDRRTRVITGPGQLCYDR